MALFYYALRYYKWTVLIFSVFIVNSSSNESPDCAKFNIGVIQRLHNEGYHRNLTYTIEGLLKDSNEDDSKEAWRERDCTVMIEQYLPSGVFSNPNELDDLRRSRKTFVITKDVINVELPAEMCGPTTVYIVGKVRSSRMQLWVPLHARYHKAIVGGGSARNDIEKPKLYLRCSNYSLENCKNEHYRKLYLLCKEFPRKCLWRDMPFHSGKNAIVWYVPVGNLNHYYTVACSTMVIVVIGSLYILNTLHDYKMAVRNKVK